ncbi:hypothetical protein [Photorhabdus stackebrandtii]|nr:hypothetical protein [Photorhabdus stackebrandtii]
MSDFSLRLIAVLGNHFSLLENKTALAEAPNRVLAMHCDRKML